MGWCVSGATSFVQEKGEATELKEILEQLPSDSWLQSIVI